MFDYGGVLVDWNREYLYRKLIPDPDDRKRFLDTICTLEWNHGMDAGRPVQEAVAELAARHPEHSELITAWWTRWPEMLGGEIPGTRVLAEAVASGGTSLYGLTNWPKQTWPLGVRAHPFLLELFDGVVVSGQEGVAKPDPRLFRILNERYSLDPTLTAYIDDAETNIVTARQLGYVTHHFVGAEALGEWLGALGVI